MRELNVYFSRKGYVKKLAEADGNDVLALKTPERTSGVLGFWWCGRFGMHRWGMELSPYTVDLSLYDRVNIYTPIWVFAVCAPVRQFLSENKGRFKRVTYTLVHFSSPLRYDREVKKMDALCGCAHESYSSICCVRGFTLKGLTYENKKINGKTEARA